MHASVCIDGLLSIERIALDVPVSAMRPAFEEIGRMVRGRCGLAPSDVAELLWKRELYSSTTLGFGIALPHAPIGNFRKPMAAFLRAHKPIPFGAPDGQPVSDLLALLVPAGDKNLMLDLLASFVRLFSDPEFREALRLSKDAHGVWHLFDERLRE